MILRPAHATTPRTTPNAVTHMNVVFVLDDAGAWTATVAMVETDTETRGGFEGHGRTAEVAFRDVLRQMNREGLVVRLRP